jgi:uncharacterized protein (TIGR02271 family)
MDKFANEPKQVVPVMAEQLEVGRRKVTTGAVRIEKQVREHNEVIDVPLLKEEVDIERVVIGRPVDGPMPIRTEGDTTIVPLVEEVLVVEKLYVLKEELRFTRRRTEHREQHDVTMHREVAEVERLDADGNPVPVRVAERRETPERPHLSARRNRIIK